MSKPLRVVELWRLPGAREAAPEGYEWAVLAEANPTFESSKALVLMCMTCTALVGIPEAHTAWHEAMRK
jgi:hypothetical protein